MSAGKMLHTGHFMRTQPLKIRGNVASNVQEFEMKTLSKVVTFQK